MADQRTAELLSVIAQYRAAVVVLKVDLIREKKELQLARMDVEYADLIPFCEESVRLTEEDIAFYENELRKAREDLIA